jgi:hypothetical protein
MWTRAFLLIALVLSGGLPAPSLAPRSSGVGTASAQVTPVGDAFAVECVRGGSATRRARSSGSQRHRMRFPLGLGACMLAAIRIAAVRSRSRAR